MLNKMLGIVFLLTFALVTGRAPKMLILTFVSVMGHKQGFELAVPEFTDK